jgi:hypothetical protein
MHLLYRATRDGWGAQSLARCENQGATLVRFNQNTACVWAVQRAPMWILRLVAVCLGQVIVRSGRYIFGGFADESMSSYEYTHSPGGSFIYALKCAAGLPPTKMKLAKSTVVAKKHRRHATTNSYGHRLVLDALGGGAGWGPVFGDGELVIDANADSEAGGSYTRVGMEHATPGDAGTFICPAGFHGATLFTGQRKFKAKEIEIYRVVSPEQLQAEADVFEAAAAAAEADDMEFIADELAAVRIQAMHRGQQERKDLQDKQDAAVKIQVQL